MDELPYYEATDSPLLSWPDEFDAADVCGLDATTDSLSKLWDPSVNGPLRSECEQLPYCSSTIDPTLLTAAVSIGDSGEIWTQELPFWGFVEGLNLFDDEALLQGLQIDPERASALHEAEPANPVSNSALSGDQSLKKSYGQSKHHREHQRRLKKSAHASRRFNPDQLGILHHWIRTHAEYPYLTETDETLLVDRTKLTRKQIRNWLTRWRKTKVVSSNSDAPPPDEAAFPEHGSMELADRLLTFSNATCQNTSRLCADIRASPIPSNPSQYHPNLDEARYFSPGKVDSEPRSSSIGSPLYENETIGSSRHALYGSAALAQSPESSITKFLEDCHDSKHVSEGYRHQVSLPLQRFLEESEIMGPWRDVGLDTRNSSDLSSASVHPVTPVEMPILPVQLAADVWPYTIEEPLVPHDHASPHSGNIPFEPNDSIRSRTAISGKPGSDIMKVASFGRDFRGLLQGSDRIQQTRELFASRRSPRSVRSFGGLSRGSFQSIGSVLSRATTPCSMVDDRMAVDEEDPLPDGAMSEIASITSQSKSGYSVTSSSRIGKRKGRRRYAWPLQKSDRLTGPTRKFRYHCTVCYRSCRDRNIWARHERTHVVREWVCMPNGTSIIDGICTFCNAPVDVENNQGAAAHARLHNIEGCLELDIADRCYARKDNLQKHVERTHLPPGIVAEGLLRVQAQIAQWRLETDPANLTLSDLWCGFCHSLSTDLPERLRHVGDHLATGQALLWQSISWSCASESLWFYLGSCAFHSRGTCQLCGTPTRHLQSHVKRVHGSSCSEATCRGYEDPTDFLKHLSEVHRISRAALDERRLLNIAVTASEEFCSFPEHKQPAARKPEARPLMGPFIVTEDRNLWRSKHDFGAAAIAVWVAKKWLRETRPYRAA